MIAGLFPAPRDKSRSYARIILHYLELQFQDEADVPVVIKGRNEVRYR